MEQPELAGHEIPNSTGGTSEEWASEEAPRGHPREVEFPPKLTSDRPALI